MKRIIYKITAFFLVLVVIIPTLSLTLSAETPEKSKPLTGKTISVLGDSISTFGDFSGGAASATGNSTTSGNNPYYKPSTMFSLSSVNDTWWMQAAQASGATILVNNSWSGSSVAISTAGQPAYKDRCVQLHDNTGDNAGQTPDIIAVYMGTNDFNNLRNPNNANHSEATLGYQVNYDTLISGGAYKTPSNTAEAYAIMLDKMTKRYPDAEIYCFTILEKRNLNSDEKSKLQQFNQSISNIAEHYGAYTVDLYNDSGIDTTVDSSEAVQNTHMANELHPNIYGMDAITNCFLSAVYENSKYVASSTSLCKVSYTMDKGIFKQGLPSFAFMGEEFSLELFNKSKASSLKIIMNGKDITSDCVRNGKIVIENVTSDISIGPDHECNFVLDTNKTVPSCTSKITQILKCTVCGKNVTGDIISPTGHKYDNDADVDCNVCKRLRTVDVPESDSTPTTQEDTEIKDTVSSNPVNNEEGCKAAVSTEILLLVLLSSVALLAMRKKKKTK